MCISILVVCLQTEKFTPAQATTEIFVVMCALFAFNEQLFYNEVNWFSWLKF